MAAAGGLQIACPGSHGNLEYRSSGANAHAGLKTLGPAVQYLAGELPVERGSVIPLQASHNTVRMHFDIKEADYIHLAKTDASFPLQTFSSLKDPIRAQVSHS